MDPADVVETLFPLIKARILCAMTNICLKSLIKVLLSHKLYKSVYFLHQYIIGLKHFHCKMALRDKQSAQLPPSEGAIDLYTSLRLVVVTCSVFRVIVA